MLPATLPQFDPRRLFRRLSRLRRRLRIVTVLQGVFALGAVVFGGAVIAGLLDWRFQLPSVVRALALVGIITAAGYILIRKLLRPLTAPADNLHLALRLEELNPELNDILASAIEFLNQPAEDEERSSPLLRRVTIRRAVRLSEDCNFGELVSLRGLFGAFFGAMLALMLGLPPVLRNPAAAETALVRLLAPFGVGRWPAHTYVNVTSPEHFPHRQALGEAFEIRAEVSGEIPPDRRAVLSVWFDGAPPVDSTWVIDDKDVLIARVEASKAQRSFRFRLKVNDGATPWHEVVVLPPPELVPLDGRPSPQIRLDFPAYTDLRPRPLPDGGSSFEAVAGTTVHLRAAVNRPVARAWIVYRPEQPVLNTSAALLSLAASSPLDVIGSTAAARSVWERVPVALDRNGTRMEVTFTPRVGGVYALRFEDETGFGATRLIDARVFADPAPVVTLERPSATRDSLNVTPAAVLPLKSAINDQLFAVRSAWLEYRTGKDGPLQTQPQFNHAAPGRALSAALAGPRLRLRLQSVLVNNRLRINALRHPDGSALKEGDVVIIQMAADDFDDVTGDKEPGRSHEIELHIVSPATLEAMLQQEQASVRANILRLQQWQKEAREKVADAKVQKDATGKLRQEEVEKLLQAEQLQQQIRARVGDDKEGLRSEVNRIREALRDNQLPPSAAEGRMDAVANELERLAREELEPLEPLLNSARESADPMRSAAPQQDLSRGQSQKSEPMKGESPSSKPMKGDAAQPGPMKSDTARASTKSGDSPRDADRSREPLDEALKHQREVEQTLEQLLQRLEPWSGANEVRGEARAVLNEQQKIGERTEELLSTMPPGKREGLEPQQQADLDAAAQRQEALGNQLKQLTEKMEGLARKKQEQQRERLQAAEDLANKAQQRERLAEEKKGTEQEKNLRAEAQKLAQQAQEQKDAAASLNKEAEALNDAARMARKELAQDSGSANQQTRMHQAARDMKENRLGKARQQQRDTTKALEKMLERLEERRSDDLDRLAKKMREAEQRLDDLVDQQERLQKKVKDAQKMTDPQQRQEELERLAREQQKLHEEARDLLQELSRLKADAAAQALSRAARGMEDAQQRLERGEKADGAQEDALEKLDQTQDQLEQERKRVEEELDREKAEKYIVRIRNLRERQDRSLQEMRRAHDGALAAKKWVSANLKNLSDQRDIEEGLSGETRSLVESQFKSIRIAAKILEHAADAMKMAADRIEARRKDITDRPDDEPLDPVWEKKFQSDIVRWQETALRRLDQFLDALKPDKELKQPGAGNPAGQQPGGGSPMGGGRPRGEDVPLLAQLKALRSLQAEINERTAQFAKDHPDLARLSDEDRAELQLLRKMQADIAELLLDSSIGNQPSEGGRP